MIEFDSVRWDDGTYTGRPPFPQVDRLIESESGQRVQLRRIIDQLKQVLAEPSAGQDLLAEARTRIDALADDEPDLLDAARLAMQRTKAVAQADIARFERGQTTRNGDVTAWLRSLLARYEAWLVRLSPP
jgi:hypothetical protein